MLDEAQYIKHVVNLLGLTLPSTEVVERIKWHRVNGLGPQAAFHELRHALGLNELE